MKAPARPTGEKIMIWLLKVALANEEWDRADRLREDSGCGRPVCIVRLQNPPISVRISCTRCKVRLHRVEHSSAGENRGERLRSFQNPRDKIACRALHFRQTRPAIRAPFPSRCGQDP